MTRHTYGDEVRSGDLTVEGNVSFAGGTDLTSALAAKADLSGATFTGAVLVEHPSAASTISLKAPSSGYLAQLILATGGDARWALVKSGAAESGSNAGSNFTINRYDDAGAFLGFSVAFNRSNNLTQMPGVYDNTSASAANVYVASNGSLLRSTSSLKYKTDVQDATDAENDLVFSLRPVTYKSLSDADDSQQRFWGFIAEEVELIDPRLVTHNEEGEPEGVQYDRIIPALVGVVQRQQAQIDALTARLDDAGL